MPGFRPCVMASGRVCPLIQSTEMELGAILGQGLLFIFLVSALFLRVWTLPTAMEQIPGTLGLPLVGESFSFLSDFSSPSGIYSFMKKRQQS